MLIYFMSLHAEYLHFVMSAYVKQKKTTTTAMQTNSQGCVVCTGNHLKRYRVSIKT